MLSSLRNIAGSFSGLFKNNAEILPAGGSRTNHFHGIQGPSTTWGYPVHHFNPHALCANCQAYSADARPAVQRSRSFIERLADSLYGSVMSHLNELSIEAENTPYFQAMLREADAYARRIDPTWRFGRYNPFPNMPATGSNLGFYRVVGPADAAVPLPPDQVMKNDAAVRKLSDQHNAMFPRDSSDPERAKTKA